MTDKPRILVTGATGFLGKVLVSRLLERGYPVRALVRRQSAVDALQAIGVDAVLGDVGEAPGVAAAVERCDVVVHAAAGTSGAGQDARTATVQGTQNILDACKRAGVRKLVYISSCNVYEIAGWPENRVVTEDAQLERAPLRRGNYTVAKLQAETLVTDAMERGDLPIVVLRPGTIYGPGGDTYTRMMGVSLKRCFVVFGNGQSILPLVHVENVVDAIVQCIGNSGANNQVFNVVDQEAVTKKLYMEKVIKRLHPGALVVYVPMALLVSVTWIQEKLLSLVGKQPFLSVYRLLSSQKRVTYSSARIERVVGWRSRIGFEQGAASLTETDR